MFLGCFCGKKFLTKNYLIEIGDTAPNKLEDILERTEKGQAREHVRGQDFVNENERAEQRMRQSLINEVNQRLETMNEEEASHSLANIFEEGTYAPPFKDHLKSLALYPIKQMTVSDLQDLFKSYKDKNPMLFLETNIGDRGHFRDLEDLVYDVSNLSNEEFFDLLLGQTEQKPSDDNNNAKDDIGDEKKELCKGTTVSLMISKPENNKKDKSGDIKTRILWNMAQPPQTYNNS